MVRPPQPKLILRYTVAGHPNFSKLLMKAAAVALDFERAAQLRDELLQLRELIKG